MPTYIYQTLPADPQAEPRRFEVVQRMSDEPLSTDPQSGEPVQRVITGGQGFRQQGLKRSVTVNRSSPASTPCSCATGHRHHHHHHHH